MKNIPFNLILLSLITGTALAPKPMYGMNEQKNVIAETKEPLNQKLLSAAKSSDIETVKNCLDSGANLNTQDNDGYTPLMWACINGDMNIVQFLVENGANLNTQDKLGWTPFRCACINGDMNMIQFLVENWANLNTQDNDGWTPLMWACINGDMNVIQYLVENGAPLNTQDIYGYTPLIWACYRAHTDIVQYLVENGAPLNTQNNNNHIAYDIAVQEGFQTIAQYLLNVQNELNKFKINPLQLTTFAPKGAFIKMLYNERIYYIDTSRYTYLCSIFAMFQKSNKNKELKTILDTCKFLQWSKKEIKKLDKIGFPLNGQELTMQENLIKNITESNSFDLKFIYYQYSQFI